MPEQTRPTYFYDITDDTFVYHDLLNQICSKILQGNTRA